MTKEGGISGAAQIGDGNTFGPGVVIGPRVRVGSNNTFGAYVCIEGAVDIGDGNYFAAHAVIGGASRQRLHATAAKWLPSDEPLISIGSENLLFEHTVVHRPLGAVTYLGDANSIGAHTHVGHDVAIESNCVLAPNVAVGGFCRLGAFANFGIGAAIHNRVVIGAYAMVGMNAAVNAHVRPGVTVGGVPAKFLKQNNIGLERSGLRPEVASELLNWINAGVDPKDATLLEMIEAWKQAVARSGRERDPL